MRRDSIFYKLFQQSPTLLFELLTNPPENAENYRVDEQKYLQSLRAK
jgi:predicted transposase YdaD